MCIWYWKYINWALNEAGNIILNLKKTFSKNQLFIANVKNKYNKVGRKLVLISTKYNIIFFWFLYHLITFPMHEGLNFKYKKYLPVLLFIIREGLFFSRGGNIFINRRHLIIYFISCVHIHIWRWWISHVLIVPSKLSPFDHPFLHGT